jgi:MinD superfamily P-loop ATPase
MVANTNSRLYSGGFRNGVMVYGELAPGEENSGKLVSLIRDKAKYEAEVNGWKNIILDGPPGIGCPVISTITGVDQVLIVTEPSVSGMKDLVRAVEIVINFNLRPKVIINKFDLNEEISDMMQKWCRENGLELYGRLPFHQVMTTAMINGKSIVEWDPHHEISKVLEEIWNKILDNNW